MEPARATRSAPSEGTRRTGPRPARPAWDGPRAGGGPRDGPAGAPTPRRAPSPPASSVPGPGGCVQDPGRAAPPGPGSRTGSTPGSQRESRQGLRPALRRQALRPSSGKLPEAPLPGSVGDTRGAAPSRWRCGGGFPCGPGRWPAGPGRAQQPGPAAGRRPPLRGRPLRRPVPTRKRRARAPPPRWGRLPRGPGGRLRGMTRPSVPDPAGRRSGRSGSGHP